MVKLYPSRDFMSNGFSRTELRNQESLEVSKILRELCQNSYDAFSEVVGGGGISKKAEIKFSLEYVNKNKIPCIQDYENAVNLIQPDELKPQEKPIFTKIKKELEKEKIPILFIQDNGVGFDKVRLASIFSNGISEKQSENSSGSNGNGHFSTFNASNLRFCLYAGKTNNKQTICSMHAILRTIEKNGEQQGSSYVLATQQPMSISKNTKFPQNDDMPSFIKEKLTKIDNSGSIVGIIGFNFFNKKEEDLLSVIKSAIVKNFFVAIENNNLEVKFNSSDKEFVINQNNLKIIFDELEELKDNEEPKSARLFYETYLKNNKHEIATDCGIVEVYIMEENIKETKIAVCRNGMWITDNKIASLRKNDFLENLPFCALILPRQNTEFAKLMKLAETNFHTSIKLSELDKENEKNLKKCLVQIRDYIKDKISKNNVDKFDIQIDGLIINMQGDTQKGSQNKSQQTMKSLLPNENIATKNPLKTEFEPDDGKTIGAKSDFSNLTKIENMKNFISRHGDSKANIKFASNKDFRNLCLGIRIDNGIDPSCDNQNIYEPKIKIKSAKNKNNELVILEQKEAISIGSVNKDEILHLEIEFNQNLQNCILHYDFYEQKENQ